MRAGIGALCLALGGIAQAATVPNLRVVSEAHQLNVTSISFDAAEKLMLTASDDKSAKLWDAQSGKLLRTFSPPASPGTGRLYGGSLSPDGGIVAVAGNYKRRSGDYAIYLYSAGGGAPLPPLAGLPGLVTEVAFTADGRWLTAFVHQVGVVIYDTRDWSIKLRESCADCRGDLALSRDGSLLVAADVKGNVWSYRQEGGQWSQAARGSVLPGQLRLAVHPTGQWVGIAHDHEGGPYVLDGRTLALSHRPAFDLRNVITNTIGWSADGKSLYAGGNWRALKGNQQQLVIKRWEDHGKGPARDLKAASIEASLIRLRALADGGLVAADFDGTIVRLGPDGRERYAIVNELAHRVLPETAAQPDVLRMARDGSAIEFRRRGDVLARGFLLAERRWGTRFGADWAPRGLRGGDTTLEDWAMSTAPKLNGKPLEMGPGQRVVSYAFSNDGKWLAIGTNRNLRLYDAASAQRLRLLPTPHAIAGVRFFKDDRALAVQYGNGQVSVYRRQGMRRLLDVFLHPNGKDWALYTPAGYFDASPAAESLLAWHVTDDKETDGKLHPFARFAEAMHRPDVIDRVLGELKSDRELLGSAHGAARDQPEVQASLEGEESAPADAPLESIVAAERAPVATLELGPRALEADPRGVTVLVGAKDRGEAVEELRLFHNGKALPVTWSPGQGAIAVRTVLLDGDNHFRAVAIGRSRIEGAPVEVRVPAQGRVAESPAPKGRLHVLVAGVAAYRNGALNLSYPVKDGRAFVAALRQPAVKRVHGEPVVIEAYDKDATGPLLRSAFDRLKRDVKPEDTVVLYLAGHGEVEGDEWYFVPHELETPELPESLRSGGLSRSWWQATLRDLPARRILLMIDACKSGGAVARSIEARRVMTLLARSTGTYIVAATQADQLAWELPGIGHGVFTHAVLETLKTPPAGKQLTVEALIAQVKARMPEITEQHAKVRQVPVSFGIGTDFPLALFD